MTARSTRPDSATSPVLLRGDMTASPFSAQPPAGAQQPVGGHAGGAVTTQFAEIAADKQVRAVVLAANGPAFCAGHDLKELTAHRTDADRRPRLLHSS